MYGKLMFDLHPNGFHLSHMPVVHEQVDQLTTRPVEDQSNTYRLPQEKEYTMLSKCSNPLRA